MAFVWLVNRGGPFQRAKTFWRFFLSFEFRASNREFGKSVISESRVEEGFLEDFGDDLVRKWSNMFFHNSNSNPFLQCM